MESSTGTIKRFKEMNVVHVGVHGWVSPGSLLSRTLSSYGASAVDRTSDRGHVAAMTPSPTCDPCSHPQTGLSDSTTSPVIVLYLRDLCARLCVLLMPPSPTGFLMSAHRRGERFFVL
jgi:hypothetical protein